ncbi:ABC transporter ATP-binding protein [Actinophytocola algeriensis]|jgi:branched-chain amino acid transport system ATP-binding protein|uniref:Branched-chain amino acid transport system ATP-binding protein n=1 Tax=Actinophytocola algeriensis TaxID=1768010 RepID=A0A7W7Q215_9PSEU|nr:ABC transporter ATP-binding protein [Actinophytocola algeriensis]MBB4905570.1 branched-chain amino acid transport system ATP-binding protein [Actinophytocola algeriensis]MBE1472745.1 branched-chain amino acid transport system ATP-binding protein [Actinophytocola algeriensis]
MSEATQPAQLRTRGLLREFSGFVAVNGVDLDVEAGTVHALVGPNGAGKTTLFNLLTGFLKPTGGRIELDGEDVTGLRPERIAQRGVARSFQITSLFEELTLVEHVELALQGRDGLGYRFWRSDKALRRYRAETDDLLEQVGLIEHANKQAGSLAYGQKRALELALALALSPRLLLLDEPTAGMGVEDVARTVELIRRVRADRTVVLVEHNMKVVGDLTDRVTVLQFGKVLAEGPYEEVRNDPRVITAYLGENVA